MWFSLVLSVFDGELVYKSWTTQFSLKKLTVSACRQFILINYDPARSEKDVKVLTVQDLDSVSEVIFFDLQERISLCCDFVLKVKQSIVGCVLQVVFVK